MYTYRMGVAPVSRHETECGFRSIDRRRTGVVLCISVSDSVQERSGKKNSIRSCLDCTTQRSAWIRWVEFEYNKRKLSWVWILCRRVIMNLNTPNSPYSNSNSWILAVFMPNTGGGICGCPAPLGGGSGSQGASGSGCVITGISIVCHVLAL